MCTNEMYSAAAYILYLYAIYDVAISNDCPLDLLTGNLIRVFMRPFDMLMLQLYV